MSQPQSQSQPQRTVLITGANRGLGLGMVKEYLSKGWKVIAAVRSPANMPQLDGIVVVKIDAARDEDASKAVEVLRNEYGIDHLDVVIANAAMGEDGSPASTVPPSVLLEHLNVNALGPLRLYQATRSLLLASAEAGAVPKFVVLSSTWGRFAKPWHKEGMLTYGTSKAALNYIARAIHFEEPRIISFPVDPGFVDTEMGQRAAGLLGRAPPQTVEYTAPKLVELIENATKEETSGNWWMFNGEKAAW